MPKYVWTAPLQNLTAEHRSNFENVDIGGIWPEVGSRMMIRVVTGQDLLRGWVVPPQVSALRRHLAL
jgi:hypothetical protein